MKNRISENTLKRYSERGLTAVELVVSMAIFLIVVGAVYGVLRIGNMSRSSINSRSENIKNVRMAINSIGREAVNAGLGYNRVGGTVPDDFTTDQFNLPPDADTDDDLLTAISAGYGISESDVSKGERNDVVAFAFRDFQFNDGFPIVINDAKEEGSKLILKTPDGACANCRPYDLFLIETGDGKKAVILSTDIINNNTIVLGGDEDPLNINYGNKKNSQKKAQKRVEDAKKELQKREDDQAKAAEDRRKALERGDLLKALDLLGLINGILSRAVQNADAELKAATDALNNLNSSTSGSAVKKCSFGETEKCVSYSSTQVVAKKIYLVSYSVSADGTLIRTTFGNNTGAGADDQIVKQPIANGVHSFKLKYLLADGTTTEDPSIANTQKEKCNDIIQIEVNVVVDSENGSSEPISLNSTFSTRNLKYDVY